MLLWSLAQALAYLHKQALRMRRNMNVNDMCACSNTRHFTCVGMEFVFCLRSTCMRFCMVVIVQQSSW